MKNKVILNFVWRQIKDFFKGGPPALWRKVCALPRWLLVNRYCLGTTLRIYKLITKLKPDFAEAQVLLAETLIELGHFDEAFAVWKKLFQLKPDWAQGHNRIQSAFYLCGQFESAKAIMQKVLDMRNDFARAHQLDNLGIRLLREYPSFIGHTGLLDFYVKMDILGQRSPAHPILLVSHRLANPSYLDYWRRYLPDMISDPVAIGLLEPITKYLEDYISAVKDSSGSQVYDPYSREVTIQEQWDAEGRGPLLTLTDADLKRGQECLQSLGVPADVWFVGLHVRGGREKARSARNADIATYRMAIESIVARGGWVFRMGDPSMEPLPPMKHVIDYAHSEARRDWMDVFLWARCSFFIGVQSGPLMIPPTFGVPCVATNWSSIGLRQWFTQDLYIYKLHWLEAEARYLKFSEVSSSALATTESGAYLASRGIKLVDNTPEEINDVVVEMMDRLDGTIKYSKEDEELKERFSRASVSSSKNANTRAGRDFLRKWSYLI
ncbi:MAG: TIGR04372 family glycosyltransferase [Dehalococcoidales bacterium]|jgi:putative glycosyltransferase (TIGR04372 family)